MQGDDVQGSGPKHSLRKERNARLAENKLCCGTLYHCLSPVLPRHTFCPCGVSSVLFFDAVGVLFVLSACLNMCSAFVDETLAEVCCVLPGSWSCIVTPASGLAF